MQWSSTFAIVTLRPGFYAFVWSDHDEYERALAASAASATLGATTYRSLPQWAALLAAAGLVRAPHSPDRECAAQADAETRAEEQFARPAPHDAARNPYQQYYGVWIKHVDSSLRAPTARGAATDGAHRRSRSRSPVRAVAATAGE